jgi:hypothetical protein
MLNAYRIALNNRVNYSDTSGILAAYRTAINNRVKYSDTVSILSAYQSALNARTKYSDTSTLLATQSYVAAHGSAYTANAPISIVGSVIKADTLNRFFGLATIGKAYNDSIILSAATNTKLAKTDTTGIRTQLVAGSNMTITGTYPNLVLASSGGASINYPNTIKKYLNGYGTFATLNTDSISQGSTNLYFTNSDTAGFANKLNKGDTNGIRPQLTGSGITTISGTYPNLVINSSITSAYNTGALLFASVGNISGDNNNLYYDSANTRLGIGRLYNTTTNLVPTLYSNTSPSPFVASCNSGSSNAYQFWGTGRGAILGAPAPIWVTIYLGGGYVANQYVMYTYSGCQSCLPTDWQLQGSNNNSTWTTLDNRSGVSLTGGANYTFSFSNTNTYTYYRFYATADQGNSNTIPGSIVLQNSSVSHITPLAKNHIYTTLASEKGQIIQGVASQTANLSEWQNSSGSLLGYVDASGNINTTGTISATSSITSSSSVTGTTLNATITKTTINGSSGTYVWSQPFNGSSYKKVVIELNAYTNASTSAITYTGSFHQAPAIVCNTTGLSISTISNTSITIPTATAVNGWIILEGY